MFGRGPEGPCPGGELQDHITSFVKLLSPQVSCKAGDNKDMITMGALMTGEHEFFNGDISRGWGRTPEKPRILDGSGYP
jgi:hypothetical protein